MDSPERYSRKNNEDGTHFLKVDCTPKNQILTTPTEEFCLYDLHRECSPNFGCGHDGLEIGWGDSPEPLNMEQKYSLSKTPVTCKKKLETKESPRSSIPFKRRNVRSIFSISSKPIIDVAKYVAEVQELSKNVMKEFSAQKTENELSEDEKLVASTQFVENNVISNRLSPPIRELSGESEISLSAEASGTSNIQNKDSALDSVLQSFINEEDDWLSQALCTQEVPKTPCKIGFVKSRSENELTIPKSIDKDKNNSEQSCRNINNNFRRTSSFDLAKPQNNSVLPNSNGVKNMGGMKRNFADENKSVQYSLQEIERKRLEAKYRKERREIERKKLEAMKRLEMKKMRVIKT